MLPLILGGLGAAANISQAAQDRDQAIRDRKLMAATAAYSPWTKMNPFDVKITKANNNITAGLGGFTAGAGAGQDLSSAFGSPAMAQSAPAAPAAAQPEQAGLGSAAAQDQTLMSKGQLSPKNKRLLASLDYTG